MNNERRTRIEQAIAKMDEATALLEGVKDDEQEAFDNLPESIQGADKGQKMEENVAAIEEVLGNIEDGVHTLTTEVMA